MPVRKSLFVLSLFSMPLWGANYSWNVDADGNWSLAGNWTPAGGPPNSTADTATFDDTVVTAARVVTVDGAFSVDSLTFNDAFGYTIAPSAGTLNLGGGASVTNISLLLANTANQLISCPLALASNIVIDQASGGGGILTISGGISGGFNVTLQGGGVVFLNSISSTYTGSTTITSGTWRAGTANIFALASSYIVNDVLDLNGFANTIKDLSGSGSVTTGGGTLTITNAAGNFSGAITGAGGLSLTGGTLVLSGSGLNTYSGQTTCSNTAILQAGALNAFSPNSAVLLLNSSTLDLSTFSNTIFSLSGNAGTFVKIGAGATLTIDNGGTYDGIIQGLGALDLAGGTLSLSNNNSYTGGTNISLGSTIELLDSGQLEGSSDVTVDGTLDISGVTTSTQIGPLDGSGSILLGNKELIINEVLGTTYSGTITGGTGSLNKLGASTLTLDGSCSYSGATTVTDGILRAGAMNVFAADSAYTVLAGATLDLNDFDNTILSLNGAGDCTTGVGVGGDLTLANASGTFSGVISENGGLILNGGSLTLTGVNTYTGGTSINAGTLALSGLGELSSTGLVLVDGIFDIVNIAPATSTNIGALLGNGQIFLGNNTLIIGTGSAANTTFSGVISSAASGSIEYIGTGILTLSGNNTYTGTTTIDVGGTIRAGGAGVFAPQSSCIVDGTLDLDGFAETIKDLSGAVTGIVDTGGVGGILTITDATGTFAGQITGSGGLTLLNNSMLTLTGTTNDYTGPTNLFNSSTLIAGAAGAFSPFSAIILHDSAFINIATFSTTIDQLTGNAGTFVDIGVAATLTINNGGTFDGIIQGAGALDLAGGTLNLSNNNTYSGGTTIQAGATIALLDAGQLSPSGAVTDNGTLDITGVTTSTQIGTLDGSGAILLGSKQLIINELVNSTFSGTITGGALGSLEKTGPGTLTLSGSTNYGGQTSLTQGTLQAGAVNVFSPISLFNLSAGTILDLNDFNNTILNLNGAGDVQTGAGAGGTLTLANASGLYSGVISGNGGLTINAGTLQLNGLNTYTGATLIAPGATLNAGGVNVLSSASSFTVNGTLGLNGNSNTIDALFGSGAVLTGLGAPTFTINNGGNFSGSISGTGNLTLNGGTLTLLGTNSYTGLTNLFNSATLQAGANNSFPPTSPFLLNDSSTVDLNGFNQTIYSIEGLSTTTQVIIGPNSTLTINGQFTSPATIFAGQLTSPAFPNCGGLTITGGTNLILTGTTNDYCGPTSILNGILVVDANGALSPNTDVTVSPGATFENGNTVTLITNSANSLVNNGTVIDRGALSLATTYTQSAGAVLNLQFETGVMGNITTVGNINIDGTLIVQAVPAFPVAGVFPLLTSTGGVVNGTFSTFTPLGFGGPPPTPLLSYSINQVNLFFSTCSNTWAFDGSGNWNDGANWGAGAGCVPGANGNTNDVATFDDIGVVTPKTVTLANAAGTLPESFTLFQLNFNATAQQYIIQQFMNGGSIILDADGPGVPTINVNGDSPIINAPIVLNKDSEMFLTDGTQITFGPSTTLTSATNQSFTITQTGPIGSGLLINNGTLTPFSLIMMGATVQNNNIIAPINALNLVPIAGNTVTANNSGPGAQMGPTGINGNVMIGGAGTTVVNNTGAGALFGPQGAGGSMTVGGAGPITLLNSGAGSIFGPQGAGGSMTLSGPGTISISNTGAAAVFGPKGAGGDMTVGGAGTTTVLNTGAAAIFGPQGSGANMTVGGAGTTTVTNTNGATFGPTGSAGSMTIQGALTNIANSGAGSRVGPTGNGGNLLMTGGTISNTLGGLVSAGPGGTFTMTGGTITNDLTSTIGASNSNLVFTGGTINDSGKILALNFTQGPAATLQLNLTSLPTQFGNVAATGTATLNGTLTVNALPGSVTTTQPVNLITATGGVIGTYPTVNLLNFPVGFFPSIVYVPNAVVLQFVPVNNTTVVNPTVGTVGQTSVVTVNQTLFLLQRQLRYMHNRLRDRIDCCCCEQDCCFSWNDNRFYIGPTGGFGEFNRRGSSQPHTRYNTVGFIAGFEHIFCTNWALGLEFDYNHVHGKVKHGVAGYREQQIHASVYGEYVPMCASELAFEAIIGGGYDWYETHRVVAIDLNRTRVKGKTHGGEFDALIGAEYTFTGTGCCGNCVPTGLMITPLANLQYIWVGIDDFRETKGGIFNTKVSHQHINSLRSTLGLRLEYEFCCGCVTFIPELDFGWQYEYLDQHHHVRFTTINLPTNTTITRGIVYAGRNTLWGGIDFFFEFCDMYDLEVSYDYLWNKRYDNHSFYLGLGVNF